ncbi:MAG: hypothetical protein R2941_14360 [Desulfobacterales bacterium]
MLRFKPEGNFKNGDKFTFTTTRDSGENIKDILVDKAHSLIYILTYFYAGGQSHHWPNVYVHDLNIATVPCRWATGEEPISICPSLIRRMTPSLFESNLAMDNPDNTKALFIGGEGINFYKATTGLETGRACIAAGKRPEQSGRNGSADSVLECG